MSHFFAFPILGRFLKKSTLFLAAVVVTLAAPHFAAAQNVIRDAETESVLREVATPIFTAAGLNPEPVRIVILGDDTINAFVAGGQNLFLYTGLLLDVKNVGELGGVIAHESGHIAGGHLIRMRGVMERASIESVLAALAGAAVGVGAGNAEAGIGVALGGGELARRVFLKNSRVFESAADQSGLNTLEHLGYSAQGMADFLERLSAQDVLPEMQRSGYIMTHPLSRERLDTVKNFVARSRYRTAPWPTRWQQDFLRIQAKLLGFTQPQRAENIYKDKNDPASRYGLAISYYRQGRIDPALQMLDRLQKEDPGNGYMDELRGQILFEQGRVNEAIPAYRAALKKEPDEALIHLALAQALLQNDKAPTDEALKHLLFARDHGEKNTPLVHRWLAVAYGRAGQEGMAKLALAEEAFLKRDITLAIQQATTAKKLLPASDKAALQRADDLLQQAKRVKKEKSDN